MRWPNRWMRQSEAATWAERVFGDAVANNLKERALRIVEEAIELAQVEGVGRDVVLKVVDRVYSRPIGIANQEVGGIGVTLIVYCHAKGLDADACEDAELSRVVDMDPEKMRKNHAAKVSCGIALGDAE